MVHETALSDADAAARDGLIEAYFRRVDDESFEELRDVFAPDVEFLPLGDPLTGVDAMIEWYQEQVTLTNMTHDVDRVLHHPSATVVEGFLDADLPGEKRLEGRFADTFEFDDETETITHLAIYIGLQPHVP